MISLLLERFMAMTAIASAFRGIRVAVAFLILRVGVRQIVRMPKKAVNVAACALAAGVVLGINLFGWRFSTVWLILCGALVGLTLCRGGAKT